VVLDPELRPRRNDEVRWQMVDEEGILVNLETGFYFSLNPVALFIWDLCDGEHSTAQILAEIVKTFDVAEDRAQQDLESFLDALRGESLLATDSASAS
jgi:hypothetical protein